jgi:oligopeptide/dipeptide ABC transporter ATP-binding protein
MPLLEARDLVKLFPLRRGWLARARGRPQQVVHAVDGVSFEVEVGETLALVGESGSGKTTLGRLVLGLLEPTAGRILFDGEDVTRPSAEQSRRLRRQVQVVFQDPYSSLDPRQRVADIVREPLDIHGVGTPAERRRRVGELLEQVHLPQHYARSYPHELSGGLRQRVSIATALALGPKLIVADEPVSALDVSVQAQILDLLAELQHNTGIAFLLISHDLGVVEQVSDRVAVMYLGKLLETGSVEQVFERPEQPYTRALLSAIPSADPTVELEPIRLTGDVPAPVDPPAGCPFHPRCWLAVDVCGHVVPPLIEYDRDHFAACHVTAAEHGAGVLAGDGLKEEVPHGNR